MGRITHLSQSENHFTKPKNLSITKRGFVIALKLKLDPRAVNLNHGVATHLCVKFLLECRQMILKLKFELFTLVYKSQ